MTIELPERFKEYVRRKIEGGDFASVEEVIAEALDRMRAAEAEERGRLEALRAELQKGLDSAARGDVISLGSDEEIDRFFDTLDAR